MASVFCILTFVHFLHPFTVLTLGTSRAAWVTAFVSMKLVFEACTSEQEHVIGILSGFLHLMYCSLVSFIFLQMTVFNSSDS